MTLPELTPMYRTTTAYEGGWVTSVAYFGLAAGCRVMVERENPEKNWRGGSPYPADSNEWHPTPEAAILAAAEKCSERHAADLAALYKAGEASESK